MGDQLLGIGKAAEAAGVSERALRYYQELGLLNPAGSTPGGLRRYSGADLDRVRRIRDLQVLLGFNLEEIKEFFANESRLDGLRDEYRDPDTDGARRRQVIEESLALQLERRSLVAAKLDRLAGLLAELDAMLEATRAARASSGPVGSSRP